ncbi:aldehyde dehydrogenase [Halovivax cerinus]|uniref:Aldehyde dehydrogenase n=1 Tax=Halovivax cerinus TaxID=1487865 RepID=A0ABD5NQ02_9EURY|nr:aldehyde dehydrogenase [Halovivax cerinus]
MESTNYDLFVDGDGLESTGDDRIPVEYPYDREVWATVPDATGDDVDAAVTAAREAFDGEWGSFGPSRRREILHQIADTVESHVDELARLETLGNGRHLRESTAQLGHVVEFLHFFARRCEEVAEGRVNAAEQKDGRMFNYVTKEPYGVVGAITPWNVPLLLSCWKLAPALAAGNTFVHKPSEVTPVSALRLAELLTEHTDLPDGAYNVVTGYGEGAGQALVGHPDVDKVAFTGSTETGRAVAAEAGRNLSAVSLELGGKSPHVIFPSADLENAANGVTKGIFTSMGQVCMAGSRVIVHEDIHDEFVDLLAERAADVVLGDPMDPETHVGPIAFERQFETVRDYIDMGREAGATLACGGIETDEEGYFVQPTVLTDVASDMRVAQEEIFGPVASVLTFRDEDEALALANDVDYGLAGAVWTEDMRQAHRAADEIRAGTIWVNEYRVIAPNVPFGGFEDSGLGREAGREGLEAYYQTKSVWMDLSGEVDNPFNPY